MSETDYCESCGLERDASEFGDCPRCRVLGTLTDEQMQAVLGAADDAWTPPGATQGASEPPVPGPLASGRAGAFAVDAEGLLVFRRAPAPPRQPAG